MPSATAGKAVLFMDAKHLPALRTGPSFLFPIDEIPDSERLYILKILKHAHAVFSSVTFVQAPQPITGIFPARKAEPKLPFFENRAILYTALSAGF